MAFGSGPGMTEFKKGFFLGAGVIVAVVLIGKVAKVF